MFKRVDRRRRREEEREELGLDGDMGEIMGLNETDSSESDTSSDEESGDDNGEGIEGSEDAYKSDEERSEGDWKDQKSAEDLEGQREAHEGLGDANTSLSTALRSPIQISANGSFICVLCPQKVLRHDVMVQMHESSQAHQRRLMKAREMSMGMNLDPEQDVREILDRMDVPEQTSKVDGAPISRRAEKRRHQQKKVKALRQKKAHAQKEGATKRAKVSSSSSAAAAAAAGQDACRCTNWSSMDTDGKSQVRRPEAEEVVEAHHSAEDRAIDGKACCSAYERESLGSCIVADTSNRPGKRKAPEAAPESSKRSLPHKHKEGAKVQRRPVKSS
ncbi:hypothetical protein K488DRAFT_88823 [Vararia minispora EC-137]|uniref:Uncharacterized protein n=1 Tax=Vararia minispora EC-137 TaxID=1314806 RepID=A0ACB8QC42_9AGAM|nr:hypothetical protein K488DRAFT_88823 [Vararia minispora EC-137]